MDVIQLSVGARSSPRSETLRLVRATLGDSTAHFAERLGPWLTLDPHSLHDMETGRQSVSLSVINAALGLLNSELDPLALTIASVRAKHRDLGWPSSRTRTSGR